MSENNTENKPASTGPEIEPASPLQVALLIYRNTPWWTLILGMGMLAGLIYMFGDADRRDIMDFLADRPQLTTEDRFEVTFSLNTDTYVLEQTVLAINREGNRLTIDESDVINRTPNSLLACREEDAEDCIDERGTLLEIRNYEAGSAASEPEGTVTIIGHLQSETDDELSLILQDGTAATFPAAFEQSRESGVLVCNWILHPDCEPLQGDIVTIKRPYVVDQVLEARRDSTVRFVEDGFVDTFRTGLLSDVRREALECPFDLPEPCTLDVLLATVPDNIIGVETGRSDGVVNVRTVDQVTVTIDADRVQSRTEVMVECDDDADPRCIDFPGTQLLLSGEVITGRLTQETDVHYFLLFEGQTEAIRYVRREITDEQRNPETCVDTDQNPPCQITIMLEGETIAGRIIEENSDSLTVELVPEKVVEVEESAITEVRRRVPADCALNNPRGCNEGIWLTIIVTFSAYALALVIGLIFGVFRVTGNPILENIATAYVEFVRGVPLVVILVISAFVIGPQLRDAGGLIGDISRQVFEVLDSFENSVFGTESFLSEAIIGLAIGYGAFLAEVFRAGIQSIPRGQMEASRSLGMSYLEAMRHVILPQAVRVVLPPLGNNFIAMLKDTSLIAFLALPDLFQRGRADASSSFQVIDVYVGVALYYVLMTLILSLLVRYIERSTRLP